MADKQETEIQRIERQIAMLKKEKAEKQKLAAERAELKMLQDELHPSKYKQRLNRIAKFFGKAEKAGAVMGKGFIAAGKDLSKAQKKFDKEMEKHRVKYKV
jgi:chromosome segregation ATPase